MSKDNKIWILKFVLLAVLVGLAAVAGFKMYSAEHDKLERSIVEHKKALAETSRTVVGGKPPYYIMLSEFAEHHIVLTAEPNEERTDFVIIGVNKYGRLRGIKVGDTVFSHVPDLVEHKHGPILEDYRRGNEFEIHDMGEQLTEWTDPAGTGPATVQVFDTPANVIQIHIHLEGSKDG